LVRRDDAPCIFRVVGMRRGVVSGWVATEGCALGTSVAIGCGATCRRTVRFAPWMLIDEGKKVVDVGTSTLRAYRDNRFEREAYGEAG